VAYTWDAQGDFVSDGAFICTLRKQSRSMNRKYLLVIVCLVGCISALSGCTQEPVDPKDESFAAIVADIVGIETPLNEGLLVPTSSQYYASDGLVDFFVRNRTGHDLYFADNIFGARGFVFKEEEARWEEVDLGFNPVVPESRQLKNGATGFDETMALFFTDGLEGYSDMRLLIIGYAEDTSVVEMYAAYADIRIVEGSDPSVTIITPSPAR
jgi:hypothetical protein